MFRIVRQLRERGITIIYISHRLNEVFDLCDNVSVLRDGKHIGHQAHWRARPAEPDQHDGRPRNGSGIPQGAGTIGDTILKVEGLSRGFVRDISFEVKSGEVFGISGLVGAGRTELARAILGIDKPESGEIYVRGKKVHYHTFADAIRDGLGLIPEDRKLQGLVQIMSVERNTTLVNLKRVSQSGVLRKGLERSSAPNTRKSCAW